jgi:dCMP deaminase
LNKEKERDKYYKKLISFLKERQSNYTILPLSYKVFQKFDSQFAFKIIDIKASVAKRMKNYKTLNKEDNEYESFIKANEKFNQKNYFFYQKYVTATILNDGTLEELEKKVNNLIRNFNIKLKKTIDEYFIEMSLLAAKRSNCFKIHVGCIIVKDKRVVSTGYNGTPMGIRNCYEGGCERCIGQNFRGSDLDKCLCIHAEENAICDAGIAKCKDATMYSTYFPCSMCAKLITQSGISKLVYFNEYEHFSARSVLEEKGIEIIKIDLPLNMY